MLESLDFMLEPGVLVFAIFCFVLLNVLIATILYPYLKEEEGAEAVSAAAEAGGGESLAGKAASGEGDPVEQRIEEFRQDMYESD